MTSDAKEDVGGCEIGGKAIGYWDCGWSPLGNHQALFATGPSISLFLLINTILLISFFEEQVYLDMFSAW